MQVIQLFAEKKRIVAKNVQKEGNYNLRLC